jgi:hypothetical protein
MSYATFCRESLQQVSVGFDGLVRMFGQIACFENEAITEAANRPHLTAEGVKSAPMGEAFSFQEERGRRD